MIRWVVPHLLAVVWVLGGHGVPTAHAAEGDELVGTWEGTSGAGGFKEIWIVKQDKGQWSVVGMFRKDDREVGRFQGNNYKFANGVLTFRQQYLKKPDPSWSDASSRSGPTAGKQRACGGPPGRRAN